MTTPPAAPAPEEPVSTAPPPPAAARVERPAGHPLRGVARALASTTGTDVILWRVLFIVLAFFDGLGIVLYFAGLLAIPQQGRSRSLAERLLQGPSRRLSRTDLVIVAVLVIATLCLLADDKNVIALAVLGVVAFLVLRDPSQGGYLVNPPAAGVTGSAPFEPAPYPAATEPFAAPAPRPRSVLGRLTVSVALLVVAVQVLLAAAGNDAITERVVLASALVVVGAGLVVGAWWGRSSGLVVLAVLLSLGLFATTAVNGVLGKGLGERTWRPVAEGAYELGIGEAVLDLRDPRLTDASGTVSARVGIGHLIVLVPAEGDRPLRLRDRFTGDCSFHEDFLRFGKGQRADGVDQRLDLAVAALPGLDIDLEVGVGEIEVCHA